MSGLLAFLSVVQAVAAAVSSSWPYHQEFAVSQAGLIKFALPPESMDALRPLQEDLRVFSTEGRELPYLLVEPVPPAKVNQPAKSFQVQLEAAQTVIRIETGSADPIAAVSLDTPAEAFVKSARLEGSADGINWQFLVGGKPIFRQRQGASDLQLALPIPGTWTFFRITIDDQRTSPIPFTGALIHRASKATHAISPLNVKVLDRQEVGRETRLSLDTGGANLFLAQFAVHVADPFFTRRATVSEKALEQNQIVEKPLASGSIYMIVADSQLSRSNLMVEVERKTSTKLVTLTLHNFDQAPLKIESVTGTFRPHYLILFAPAPGAYYLASGNRQTDAAKYDLSLLKTEVEKVPLAGVRIGPITANPSYRASEVLPDLEPTGSRLDTSSWPYRKEVVIQSAGGQQLELDLEVLSRARDGFRDLRLVRDGMQIPFLIENTSIQRSISVQGLPVAIPKTPSLSRWVMDLPFPSLPVKRLTCSSPTALFQREMILFEETRTQHGENLQRRLGTASWIQKPDQIRKELDMILATTLESSRFFLETNNGDNPPIVIEKVEVWYPATRLSFKSAPGKPLFLYFGNPKADFPKYDLSLVADQLMRADKQTASLGPQQKVAAGWSFGGTSSGWPSILFWAVLSLVVIGLLVIMSRLLPQSTK